MWERIGERKEQRRHIIVSGRLGRESGKEASHVTIFGKATEEGLIYYWNRALGGRKEKVSHIIVFNVFGQGNRFTWHKQH